MKGWWRIEEDEISWMWTEGVLRKLMSWLETPDPVPLTIADQRSEGSKRMEDGDDDENDQNGG